MCVKFVRGVADGKVGKGNKSQMLRSLRKLLEDNLAKRGGIPRKGEGLGGSNSAGTALIPVLGC